MRVVGYHLSNDEIVNSDGEIEKQDYLTFLLKPKDGIKVFYHLDWAVARLCYLLNINEAILKNFWKTGTMHFLGHDFFYVHHRYLSIKYGKHWGQAEFSDIYQYDVDLPLEIDPLIAAKKASELGQRVYDVLSRLNLNPLSLSSPIAALQKEILKTMDLPTWKDIPDEVLIYANRALHGGWQECFKRGHYQAWDYDITSAFSYHTANLIDIRKGKWEKSTKFYDTPMGFCKGTAKIEKSFSPIILSAQKTDYTPYGEIPDITITNKQVKQLYEFEIGKFKIENGWFWRPQGKLEYPLKELTETLFEWKSVLKGFDREIIKRILVGLTGKLGEYFPSGEFGKFYNLPGYSWVQDATKRQNTEFVITNHAEDNLLSIAVDGCSFNREIPLKESDAMGTWRFNLKGNAYIVSSGVSCIEGKQTKGGWALKYDWLKSQIESNPDADYYSMAKLAPVMLGNALKNNKLDKLGELELTERSIKLKEIKRIYPQQPLRGADLNKQYDSLPMPVSIPMAQIFSEKLLTNDKIGV